MLAAYRALAWVRRKSADQELRIVVAARFVNRKRRAAVDQHCTIAEAGRQTGAFVRDADWDGDSATSENRCGIW